MYGNIFTDTINNTLNYIKSFTLADQVNKVMSEYTKIKGYLLDSAGWLKTADQELVQAQNDIEVLHYTNRISQKQFEEISRQNYTLLDKSKKLSNTQNVLTSKFAALKKLITGSWSQIQNLLGYPASTTPQDKGLGSLTLIAGGVLLIGAITYHWLSVKAHLSDVALQQYKIDQLAQGKITVEQLKASESQTSPAMSFFEQVAGVTPKTTIGLLALAAGFVFVMTKPWQRWGRKGAKA